MTPDPVTPDPEPYVGPFEPIVTRIQIANAAKQLLRSWLPAYIAEIERQNDLEPESLPMPRSYSTRTEVTKWGEDQTPAVVIVCPGLSGPPKRDGQGIWSTPWGLAVAVITSGKAQESVIANSSFYGAALRACLLQRGPLPGVDGRLFWLDEAYTDIPEGDSRSLAAARVEFECLIPAAVNDMAGPAPTVAPPEDPYAPPENWPAVNTTHLTTSQED